MTNMTQNASLCWAKNLTIFHEQCNNVTVEVPLNISKWIILNPFDSKDSNEIIDDVKNNATKNVTGLIFETNQIITTNQTYSEPSIISEASYGLSTKSQ